MQDISISTLLDMTVGLASGHNEHERFNKLVDAIRKAIQCDCVALLSLQGETLVPLAVQGMTRDTLGRRFNIADHPRFEQICQATSAVKFDADCPLPDPFDSLLLDYDGDLPMHSCMGLPLIYADQLLGILTFDSLSPQMFDAIPNRSLEALSAIVASHLKIALTVSQLEQQAQYTQKKLEELNQQSWQRESSEIIGESTAMQELKSDISVVSASDFTILIHGETGVGKELVARSIHHQSHRSTQPMVYVNCAAIPENLVESELFGHVKGAFTGADRSRLGKFSLADGGTLFLDEIGELSLSAQSKLLRALQNNEIQPVGQDNVQSINVRVLAATNRNLKHEVEAGRFRADLYHRLSVYPIEVPPLRDRGDDVTLLAGYFLEQVRKKLGIVQIKLAREAQIQLPRFDWPGNVRELEHVINRAALKARANAAGKSTITVRSQDLNLGQSDTPPAMLKPALEQSDALPTVTNLRTATDDYQRQIIIDSLKHADFNWAEAARSLSVDRANLVRLAKRLGLSVTKQHKIEF
ncbi:nitric oxide reductase transcriptional regulator NorR [Vibrio intestinalis]|uniref:nitric oxide reductase transcriptional regulator NorR n=1 Tax=Vibrio intestinalis TaxID=2933291 RepID=UPI0021A5E4B2|nr:nitric oxide reductase transcriptional regulator NorR [Vibrio intestinalis]